MERNFDHRGSQSSSHFANVGTPLDKSIGGGGGEAGDQAPGGCCGFLQRMMTTPIIITSALLGLGLGVGLSTVGISEDVAEWVAMPGTLFLRALKCIVLPLVFFTIIVAISDMLDVGKAAAIGGRTIGMYMMTTVIAVFEGLAYILLWRNLLSESDAEEAPPKEPEVNIECPDGGALYQDGDQIVCLAQNDTSANPDNFVFQINDLNGYFATVDEGGVEEVSVADTIRDGILFKMIPQNITQEFYNANFLGVITFAIMFAVGMKTLVLRPGVKNFGMEISEQLNMAFMAMVTWVVNLTPIAVFFLVAGAVSKEEDIIGLLKDVAVLVASALCAFATHMFVALPAIFFFVTRTNPYKYLPYIAPAQVFAFASASSAATIPVSMKCVASTNQVPASLRQFVISLGATINMDGGAIYFPTATIFLATTMGYEVGFVEIILIVLLSTLGSIGTAPVPNASLVLILTAFNTTFNTTGTPETFSYILAIDWFMDRMRTVTNVTGDCFMARIVTSMVNHDDLDEIEHERAESFAENYDDINHMRVSQTSMVSYAGGRSSSKKY